MPWLLLALLASGTTVSGCCCAKASGIGKDPDSGTCYFPSNLAREPWTQRRTVDCPLDLECDGTPCNSDADCLLVTACAEVVHCNSTVEPLCQNGACRVTNNIPNPGLGSCETDRDCARMYLPDGGTVATPGQVCKAQICIYPLDKSCP